MNVFYVVAKTQNISNAAKELGVTQPAVSRIISTLEKEYNTKLFNRSKTGVTLTREGLNLFEMIQNPFIELEKIESSLNDITNLRQSVIHIGATSVALYCYLFKTLNVFKEKFPKVSFKIYTDSSDALIKLVEKGKIDFAFVTTPSKGNDEIEFNDIAKIENILIASNGYKEELKGPISIKSLEKYPFVLLNKEMQFREQVNLFLAKHNTKINPIYEIDSSSLLIPLLENTKCLTFIPDLMAEKPISEGRCFKVDLIEELPCRYVSFAIKKDAIHSHIVHEIKREIIK